MKDLFQQPYVLLTLTALMWASNAIIGRAIRLEIDPITLAVWRWSLAALLLGLLAGPWLRRDSAALWRCWRVVLLCALTGISGFNTLLYQGLQSTTALNGALVQSAIPMFIVGLAYLSLGDRLNRWQFMGLLLSLVGVTVILCRGDWRELQQLQLNRGDLWVLVAVICYAIYSVALRGRPQKIHPLSWLAVTFVPGALFLWPLHLFISPQLIPDAPHLWGVIGYLALGPSFLAYLCFNRGVELVGPGRAGQFIHLIPVFTSLMAVVFLGEQFAAFHGIGMAFIAMGIVLANYR